MVIAQQPGILSLRVESSQVGVANGQVRRRYSRAAQALLENVVGRVRLGFVVGCRESREGLLGGDARLFGFVGFGKGAGAKGGERGWG